MTPPVQGPSLRAIVPSLVVDGLCPLLVFKALTTHVPTISPMIALALGAAFPATKGVVGIWRRRRVDIIGGIVLIGIAVGIVAMWLGKSPRAFLMRESFVTGALGVLALSSFAWRRPLFFYVGRQFAAGQDPAELERFDGLWQFPPARRAFRVLTLVWAIGWLVEFAARTAIVLTLSIDQVLAIGPVVFTGITVGLIAWTLGYVRRQRRLREAAESGAR